MLGAAFPATLGELTVGGNATSVPRSWAAAGSRATVVACTVWRTRARGRSGYSGRPGESSAFGLAGLVFLFWFATFWFYLSEETGGIQREFQKEESKEVATAGLDRPEWGRSPRAGLVRRSARRGVVLDGCGKVHDALDDVMMEF